MCGEKPERLFGAGDRSWITPACAGKSWSNALPCSRREDHPRVCGEKFFVTYPATYRYGITPACAGKRSVDGNARLSEQDHPRMCGEKLVSSGAQLANAGSPPHVRGKVFVCFLVTRSFGITPACAGKSYWVFWCCHADEDHPRMCGEKLSWFRNVVYLWGSPPHVRGKGRVGCARNGEIRITPACAGKRLKRSRSTVPPVAIVPLFPSVCNKPVVSDGSPAGRDAPLFLPAENAVPASPAYNLRSL